VAKTATRKPEQAGADGGSLADRAYRALRDRIVSLELEPGAVLSEEALSADLNIGRTPVRDAIRRLARDGLIVILPRRGTLVSEINLNQPLQIAEVRDALEALAAKLAAERITDVERPEVESLRRELVQTAAGAPFGALMALDARVHRLIYRLARNPLLQQTLETYYNLACRVWNATHPRMPEPLAREMLRHADLLAAVERGDAEAAEALAHSHVDASTLHQR
jgi:DNA-binding GntR family transcriptional regulator